MEMGTVCGWDCAGLAGRIFSCSGYGDQGPPLFPVCCRRKSDGRECVRRGEARVGAPRLFVGED